jgi:uncharacterized protein (DUF697 family)
VAFPLDIRDQLQFGLKLNQQVEERVRLLVLVELDAPEPLLDAAKEKIRPRTASGTVDVEVCDEGTVVEPAPHTDAVILLAGSGTRAGAASVAAAHREVTPVVVLAVGEELGGLDYRLGQPSEDVLLGLDPLELCGPKLGKWLADRLVHKRLPLARNFEFAREAVANTFVTSTAWQNALIGAVVVFPGADMPLMTANQAKMILRIAAAYGEPVGAASRLGELAAVVGSGYLFRTVARQVLTAVPGFGWAVKGGIGFTGTVAMGKAAVAYFEQGADVGEIVQDLVAKVTDGDEASETIESDAVVVDARPELPLAEAQAARADGTG